MTETRHGTLSFPLLSTIARQTIIDALDEDTLSLIMAPGTRADDLAEFGGEVDPHSTCLAIVEDGRFVGAIIFRPVADDEWGSYPTNVGFWIRRSRRRSGILESTWLRLSPKYGMNFSAGCWPHNVIVQGVLEKLGFRQVARQWHPDGDFLAYETSAGGDDDMELRKEGTRTP